MGARSVKAASAKAAAERVAAVRAAPTRGGAVQALRQFNRYYTNRLGLLSRYRFDTNLTLTEARVIFEIGRAGERTQSALGRDLKVDLGYLNRIVRRLGSAGLIETAPDRLDGRVSVLSLTAAGRVALEKINTDSDIQVEDMIRGLSDREQAALVAHLEAARRLLEMQASRRPVIERAEGLADIRAARTLMKEYVRFLGVDLSFQGFEEELAALPGKYVPPSGALFLARAPARDGHSVGVPAGCVALRKLAPGICEMKRLFIRPRFRGLGLGRALAERVIDEGRALGYRVMRLDTLDRLKSAVGLYRSLGFRRIPPYYENPMPGVMFWELRLRGRSPEGGPP
ncbi:MAG TPA: helix-turn-helix domain-containing GNAT family N-acetyltransferase [Spirochaetia bacterium]|nr:helix-turn-helix domain-containing GNAT family N-acetyltransferase [Spirochaetia bacterium]